MSGLRPRSACFPSTCVLMLVKLQKLKMLHKGAFWINLWTEYAVYIYLRACVCVCIFSIFEGFWVKTPAAQIPKNDHGGFHGDLLQLNEALSLDLGQAGQPKRMCWSLLGVSTGVCGLSGAAVWMCVCVGVCVVCVWVCLQVLTSAAAALIRRGVWFGSEGLVAAATSR